MSTAAQSFGQKKVVEIRREWELIQEAEAQRKTALAYLQHQREALLQANATEETRNKVRESVVARMMDRQQMTGEQYRAAVEIGRVWEAITRKLFATTCRFGAIGGSAEGNWPASLSIAYRERYAPWRDEQGRIIVFRNISACELVFGLACDNFGPRQLADHYRVDQRTLKNAACESLYRYAELSGWVEKKMPAFDAIALKAISGA